MFMSISTALDPQWCRKPLLFHQNCSNCFAAHTSGSTCLDGGHVQGGLAALDLSEKSELLDCLVPIWLRPVRTTYEGDFGTPLGDFYFFPSDLVVWPPCACLLLSAFPYDVHMPMAAMAVLLLCTCFTQIVSLVCATRQFPSQEHGGGFIRSIGVAGIVAPARATGCIPVQAIHPSILEVMPLM